MKEIAKQLICNNVINKSADGNISSEQYNNYYAIGNSCSRYTISYYMERLINRKYGHTPNTIIALSIEAIPWAALLCQKGSLYCDVSFGYICSQLTDGNDTIDVKLDKSTIRERNIILIEDCVSDSKHLCFVIDYLRSLGASILGLVSIFSDNNEKTLHDLKCKQVTLTSLTDIDEVNTCYDEFNNRK